MHLNDPRELVPEGGLNDRARFYFDMLNLGFEGAVAGLMQELGCDRDEAIRRLAQSYERIDRGKIAARARQAAVLARAG